MGKFSEGNFDLPLSTDCNRMGPMVIGHLGGRRGRQCSSPTNLDANEENTIWLKKPSSLYYRNVGVGGGSNRDESHPLGTFHSQTTGGRPMAPSDVSKHNATTSQAS